MDLSTVVQAHSEWKVRFRSAISKKEQVDAATVSADNACPFGKWLHGDARTQYSQLGSYKECLDRHALFHKQAGEVARAINSQRFAEAEALLDGSGAFNGASNELGVAIMKLRKEAKI